MKQYDVIIVGAGPAGMSAAVYAARAELDTLMVDSKDPGGQIIDTNVVQNYIGVGSQSADLHSVIGCFSIPVAEGAVPEDEVVPHRTGRAAAPRIGGRGGSTVLTRSSSSRSARPRSAACGKRGEIFRNGISWCVICDGAQYVGKDVVVIGGGNSGVKESLFLANIAT